MNRKVINPIYPYTYTRMLFALRSLCEKYGEIISVLCAGRSEQGRSIPVISLGKGEKKFLSVGAVHGREYVSTGFLLMCIEEYIRTYCKGDMLRGFDVRKILNEYTFHIVPMANPDSVEIALGRAAPCVREKDFSAFFYKNNSNNVNINGNFPYLWDCVPKSRQGGEKEASESETRFLISLCEEYRYENLLSFHSRGDCLYWRDDGNGEITGDIKLAEKLGDTCGFSFCPPTKEAEDYAGGFENWFRYRFSRPAICVELVKNENAGFMESCRDFYNLVRWDETCTALLCAAE